ncbi:MAG: hypothetical protein E7656_09060 [Ruminococcaceae bacterium]|nr:hypothetical protein [Oscillospiraceae bacterium]
MAKKRKISDKSYSDDRPLEEVWERMYCDPLECDEMVYSLKNKEKIRFSEKNEENEGFFG